jgi:formylglycine-generating enzyme required for sulfatase activity
VPEGMVWVPPGPFIMGGEYGFDVQVARIDPGFFIACTPVTNTQYARFVEATGHRRPEHWKSRTPPAELHDHPIVYVSWHDAVAYAEWAGERLPTEEEWEKAARGTDGRKYPWGDEEPTPDLCNFGKNEGGTTPVGNYSPQGDSPCGCADMAGNVWEWAGGDYDDKNKVLRGGSWGLDPGFLRSASRDGPRPVVRGGSGGFRCARGSE